jgi:hypothetical protein
LADSWFQSSWAAACAVDPSSKSSVALARLMISPGVVQVRIDVRARTLRAAGQQRPGVPEHHGVVVDVNDPAIWRGPLRRFMCVLYGRQVGADVEELAHVGRGREIAHHATQEGAVRPGDVQDRREHRDELVGCRAVYREVVLAARLLPDYVDSERGYHGENAGRNRRITPSHTV